MRVAILGDAGSIHIVRWANGLASVGVDVHLFSVHKPNPALHEDIPFHKLPFGPQLGYLLAGFKLKRLLNKLRPDLLNAHYATGYGLIARLSGFQPILSSVWGSDVYDFPQRSLFHRALLKWILSGATVIGSTSQCMAKASSKIYSHSKIVITPFGIDEKKFSPSLVNSKSEAITIGTVKALKKVYGIDTLMEAAAIARKILAADGVILRLEITGEGPERGALEALSRELEIDDITHFYGAISNDKVPEALARLDIYLALSRAESFGVAALEAASCEKPVIVSEAEGLAEITTPENGIVVPIGDSYSAAMAIVKLVRNHDMRLTFGRNGRRHILNHYRWANSIEKMTAAYRYTINTFEKKV